MPLVDAYQDGLARLRSTTARAVELRWSRLPAYNVADVAPFVDSIVPVVEAGQLRAVALTAAYMSRRTGTEIVLEPAAIVAATRTGLPTAEVYRRPFVTVWTALKNGEAYRDAVAAGLARATSTAEMDIALATRDAAAEALQSDERIVGWERVPDGGACEFCLMAATQRYSTGDLMPLHNRCGCTVEPIFGEIDPGHVLHKDQLAALKVGDVSEARRLAGERLQVREHGELGPMLTERGQHFDGPAQI